MKRPNATRGLRHVALQVRAFEDTVAFYKDIIGMQIDWQPDADNVYLSTRHDNLALHRLQGEFASREQQHLDHIGFIMETPEDVDAWHDFFVAHNVPIKQGLKTHRDGARSFYAEDPDGNVVQMIYIQGLLSPLPLVGEG